MSARYGRMHARVRASFGFDVSSQEGRKEGSVVQVCEPLDIRPLRKEGKARKGKGIIPCFPSTTIARTCRPRRGGGGGSRGRCRGWGLSGGGRRGGCRGGGGGGGGLLALWEGSGGEGLDDRLLCIQPNTTLIYIHTCHQHHTTKRKGRTTMTTRKSSSVTPLAPTVPASSSSCGHTHIRWTTD